MKPEAILFDLDGTLLPMDQDKFTKYYFSLLAERMARYGYDPKAITQAVWDGTKAMIKNDGSQTNEEAFWALFADRFGEASLADKPKIDAFYREEFRQVQKSCGFQPKAAEAVARIKAMGIRTALATNPIFPAIATQTRIGWAGLRPDDFEVVTTYENSTTCKPNPAYYHAVLSSMNLAPESCLMVGNDVDDDMPAAATGMKVFLLTDCLINRKEKDISAYPQGDFDALLRYIEEL